MANICLIGCIATRMLSQVCRSEIRCPNPELLHHVFQPCLLATCTSCSLHKQAPQTQWKANTTSSYICKIGTCVRTYHCILPPTTYGSSPVNRPKIFAYVSMRPAFTHHQHHQEQTKHTTHTYISPCYWWWSPVSPYPPVQLL